MNCLLLHKLGSTSAVFAYGPETAQIAVVGEAPGEQEVLYSRPFIGKAGQCLRQLFLGANLTLDDCLLCNVVPYRPQRNDFSVFYEKGKQSEFLKECIENLHTLLRGRKPKVIVCCGAEASKAILGTEEKITSLRGSVFESEFGIVLCMLHPSALLRFDGTLEKQVALIDLMKIHKLLEPNYEVKEYPKVRVLGKLYEVYAWARQSDWEGKKCAFDIETEFNQVQCIGFCREGEDPVVIPFFFRDHNCWLAEQEVQVWEELRSLFEREDIKFVAHNAMFDMSYLKFFYGIEVKNLWMDTMNAHHVCYPEMEKSLGFCTSVYTDYSFYKEMRSTSDMNERWQYCANDVFITVKIASLIEQELWEQGMSNFYFDFLNLLIYPLLNISLHGITIDHRERGRLLKKHRKAMKDCLWDLEILLESRGLDMINPNSSKQVSELLYSDLALPKQYDGRGANRKVTTNEKALQRLALKEKSPEAELLLEHRKLRKMISTYLDITFDKDKKLRGTYKIYGTVTGRLASSGSCWNTGTQLQNLDHRVHSMIVAPSGKVLVSIDYSQAELIIVAYIAQVVRMLHGIATGQDLHTITACVIYNKQPKNITYEERQMGKKTNHALNYGMGVNTFAENIGRSVAEAKKILNAISVGYPELIAWRNRIEKLMKYRGGCRELTNLFGRKRRFFGSYSDKTVREALAYVPQSTIGDLLNKALLGCWEKMEKSKGVWRSVNIIMQIHDSLVFEVPEEGLEEFVEEVKPVFRIPIPTPYHGDIFIPTDIKVGRSFAEMEEYKK